MIGSKIVLLVPLRHCPKRETLPIGHDRGLHSRGTIAQSVSRNPRFLGVCRVSARNQKWAGAQRLSQCGWCFQVYALVRVLRGKLCCAGRPWGARGIFEGMLLC